MSRYLTLLLLLVRFCVYAQVMEGIVMDKEAGIQSVTIINNSTREVTISDKEGHFAIKASAGDTIRFSHTAYQPTFRVMTFAFDRKYVTVVMKPMEHALKEAVVRTLTKYQLDSLARHELYSHELNKIIVPRPKFYGIGCAGCIGWLVDKITGNSKKPKRFRKNFAVDDETMFIDSRYTLELVMSLIPLRDTDSVAKFMLAYPMANDFARSGTELEIKSWIRNNYKEYVKTYAKKD